jgi:hypothetical protein
VPPNDPCDEFLYIGRTSSFSDIARRARPEDTRCFTSTASADEFRTFYTKALETEGWTVTVEPIRRDLSVVVLTATRRQGLERVAVATKVVLGSREVDGGAFAIIYLLPEP